MVIEVIDPQTGEYPNLDRIALDEYWAEPLSYCDVQSFALDENGCLFITDSLGNIAYPPLGRFKIKAINPDQLLPGHKL